VTFQPNLKPGDVISNAQLVKIFKCSSQGGMRRSHRTNTLVIVSDHSRAIYRDRWVDGIFHYTGMGLRGDQSLSYRQNKTLVETRYKKHVDVHLFEVFVPNQYIYRGQVELAGEPYQETQPDVDGNPRKVWVFPLRLISDQSSLKSDQSPLKSAQSPFQFLKNIYRKVRE